jgi:hypothetical protein
MQLINNNNLVFIDNEHSIYQEKIDTNNDVI